MSIIPFSEQKTRENSSFVSHKEEVLMITRSLKVKELMALKSQKVLSSPCEKTKRLLSNYIPIEIHDEDMVNKLFDYYDLKTDKNASFESLYELIKIRESLNDKGGRDVGYVLERAKRNGEYLRLVKIAVECLKEFPRGEVLYKLITLRYMDKQYYLEMKEYRTESEIQRGRIVKDYDVMEKLGMSKSVYYDRHNEAIIYLALMLFGNDELLDQIEKQYEAEA